MDQTLENRPSRRSNETIPVCLGGLGPCRFWSRGLASEDELKELSRKGWIIDKTKFALKPEDFPVVD